MKPLPADHAGQVAEVRRRVGSGESPRQVGRSAGIPTWRVRELLIWKPPPRVRNNLGLAPDARAELAARLRDRYENHGASLASLAGEGGCTPAIVRRLLIEAGTELRKRGPQKPKPRIREPFVPAGMDLEAAQTFQSRVLALHGVVTKVREVGGDRFLVEHDPQACPCQQAAHPDRKREVMA